MKTKVDVHDLCKGMYVTELDRPWLGTPFLFQGFEIVSDKELTELRALCRHVYVLSEDARPARVARPSRMDHNSSPTPIIAQSAIEFNDMLESSHNIPENGIASSPYVDQAPVEDELREAVEIEHGTRDILYSILDDVRTGHRIDSPGARKAIAKMTESIIRNPDALVWLTHLKKKHEYTALHSLRVSVLALTFGRHLGFGQEKLNILGLGALLHDIGKLRVPTEILEKPDSLTAAEFETMKQHVPNGIKILESAEGIPPAALEVVGRHHERYSGNGYVFGMEGNSIGEFGLISAIVDTYDAITSDRAYHASLPAATALKIIYEGRRRAFHPWLAEQFIQCMGIFPIGSIVELSTGGIGVVIAANRLRRLRPRVAMVLSPEKELLTPGNILDLMTTTQADGQPLDIRTMLPSGAYGINPTDYIPVHA